MFLVFFPLLGGGTRGAGHRKVRAAEVGDGRQPQPGAGVDGGVVAKVGQAAAQNCYGEIVKKMYV